MWQLEGGLWTPGARPAFLSASTGAIPLPGVLGDEKLLSRSNFRAEEAGWSQSLVGQNSDPLNRTESRDGDIRWEARAGGIAYFLGSEVVACHG